MPNNYLSVLYKRIIQVENKNVGLLIINFAKVLVLIQLFGNKVMYLFILLQNKCIVNSD